MYLKFKLASQYIVSQWSFSPILYEVFCKDKSVSGKSD